MDAIERMLRGTGRIAELLGRLIGSPKLLLLVVFGLVLLVYNAIPERMRYASTTKTLPPWSVSSRFGCGGGGAPASRPCFSSGGWLPRTGGWPSSSSP
jgi:hypothetical protein